MDCPKCNHIIPLWKSAPKMRCPSCGIPLRSTNYGKVMAIYFGLSCLLLSPVIFSFINNTYLALVAELAVVLPIAWLVLPKIIEYQEVKNGPNTSFELDAR